MRDFRRDQENIREVALDAVMRNPYRVPLGILIALFASFCPFAITFNIGIEAKLSEIEETVQRAWYVFQHNSHEGALLLLVGTTIVLFAAFIVFCIIDRSRSPYRDPVDAPALILTVAACVIVALVTLSLLNNPILWALGTLAVIYLGALKMSN